MQLSKTSLSQGLMNIQTAFKYKFCETNILIIMRKFKEGQRVWWNDPANETSGEYKVLDPKDEYNSDVTEEDIVDFDDRMILVGNGVGEAEVYAEELDILNSLSFSEMEQIETLKKRSQNFRQELIKKMEDVIAQCDNQTLSVKGYSCKVCDEDHNSCCVTEFSLQDGILYAALEYNDTQKSLVPVANLCIEEMFDAFYLLLSHI